MKITKKHIQKVLRTLDRTQIYKLCRQMSDDGNVTQTAVFNMMCEYAPTVRVRKAAFNIAYNSPHDCIDTCFKGVHGWFKPLPKQHIVDYLKEMVQFPQSEYVKVPIMGHTHLYFAHPAYGHKDYNKWRAIKIEGNEVFCNTLISYAKKYIQY